MGDNVCCNCKWASWEMTNHAKPRIKKDKLGRCGYPLQRNRDSDVNAGCACRDRVAHQRHRAAAHLVQVERSVPGLGKIRAVRTLTYSTPKPRPEPKPKGWRARQTAKKFRLKTRGNGAIREYVFEREQGMCRCCRCRRADSMHELLFRSLGGKVSKRNSVAVCGDGVRGCHGYLQRNEIDWQGDAEERLSFQPLTKRAAEWMRIKLGLWIVSMPGNRNEELEAC